MEQSTQPEGNGHDRGDTFVDQIQQAQTAARDQLERIDRTFRDIVAGQPLAAMGIALGVGYMVGRLMRR